MGTYTYLHTYRFISDALRRCPLLWINRLGWISFGRWFSSIDTFIDLFTTRFWKSILESCHENEEPHFKPDLMSAKYDTLGGLRSIVKIDTRDFSRPGQNSSDLHFVNAGIYIKNLFYLFYRKQIDCFDRQNCSIRYFLAHYVTRWCEITSFWVVSDTSTIATVIGQLLTARNGQTVSVISTVK